MALHPTGSDKILEICTDSISFVIKNKDARHSIESRDSSVEITADKLNYIKAETCGVDDRYDFSCPTNVRVKTPPLFFENSDYEIVIKSRHGEAVSVWHEDADIRRKLGAVTEGDLGLLSGIVNFGNNIGYSDFEVSVDGKAVLRVTIEIFPSVIDYKKHYQAMIDDISREVYSSVVDYLQKTYHWLCIGDTVDTSPSVFFQIISAIFEKYVKAANMLSAHPHHKLSAEYSVLPAHKASITDNRSIKWLSRHPESAKRTDKGICATKILAVQKCVIYDTPENRFAKFIILSTVKQLVEFRKRYVDGAESADAAVFDRMTAMIFSLKRLVSSTFLKSVGDYRASESMSLVFGMAPGYRELYKYHLMLKKGLSVSGDLFKLSVKDTAVLYEYWCFIKLVSIFKKKKYRLFSDDIIKVDKRGITVDLEKGNKSRITFVNPRTGEKISLCYDAVENEYDNSKSGIVLLDKMSGDGVERLIFSPKYKTAEDKDGNVIPIKEDINELYKYREMFNLGSRSILSSLFGRGNSDAFVLYPCSDENEFEGRGIYNKYSRTGALPFLPEATASAERLIGNLVSDADSSSFDLPVLPYKLEEKLSEVVWDRKDVLVGSVGSVEQFRDNIARKYY